MKKLKLWAIFLLIISLVSCFVIDVINKYNSFLNPDEEFYVFCSCFFLSGVSIILFSIYNFLKPEKKMLSIILCLIGLAAMLGISFLITIKLLGYI